MKEGIGRVITYVRLFLAIIFLILFGTIIGIISVGWILTDKIFSWIKRRKYR